MDTKNIKIGAKIRKMRRDLGKTQSQMAELLSVSPSYLNLIEHNRRKVTVGLLLQFSEIFGVEISELAEDDEGQLFADLMEVLSSDLFEDLDITNNDVRDLVSGHPSLAKALLLLDGSHSRLRDEYMTLANEMALEQEDFSVGGLSPSDRISDFLQSKNNYFPDLEEEADRVRREIATVTPMLSVTAGRIRQDDMIVYLKTALDVTVRISPPGERQNFQRRFDPIDGVLEISDQVPVSSRRFLIAQQIALLVASPVIDMLLVEGNMRDAPVKSLGRTALAGYFAAALIMPYDDILKSAWESRYDIELLQHRYDASFEQVTQRLTSLNKPEARGIPLHFLRVDIAGNISKRFSLSGLPIPRHGGACTRWNVYSAFLTPERILAQMSHLPNGTGVFCIARTVRKGGVGYGTPQSVHSIGLGCDAKYAAQMIYSDGIDLDRADRSAPIGVNCRICDRHDCAQRVFPPMHSRFQVDENLRGISPFSPAQSAKQKDPGPTR